MYGCRWFYANCLRHRAGIESWILFCIDIIVWIDGNSHPIMILTRDDLAEYADTARFPISPAASPHYRNYVRMYPPIQKSTFYKAITASIPLPVYATTNTRTLLCLRYVGWGVERHGTWSQTLSWCENCERSALMITNLPKSERWYEHACNI